VQRSLDLTGPVVPPRQQRADETPVCPYAEEMIMSPSIALLSMLWLPLGTPQAETAQAQAPASAEQEKLTEKWSSTLKAGERTYDAWVEQGWIKVKRRDADDVTQWELVLAAVTDSKPPSLTLSDLNVRFELSYLDGRYFVREEAAFLRCVRQKKSAEDEGWPRLRWPRTDFG
jgi:hypothetical protein